MRAFLLSHLLTSISLCVCSSEQEVNPIEQLQGLADNTELVWSSTHLKTTTALECCMPANIFDLQGRRLSRIPQKGLYIKDRKKYVRK